MVKESQNAEINAQYIKIYFIKTFIKSQTFWLYFEPSLAQFTKMENLSLILRCNWNWY